MIISGDKNDSTERYLVGIVASLAIVIVISLVLVAYLAYQNRLKSPTTGAEQKTTENGNNLENVPDDPERMNASTYEQVNDEQSYTGLNRSGVEEYDDRSYAHLNQVADVYVMQDETGI